MPIRTFRATSVNDDCGVILVRNLMRRIVGLMNFCLGGNEGGEEAEVGFKFKFSVPLVLFGAADLY